MYFVIICVNDILNKSYCTQSMSHIMSYYVIKSYDCIEQASLN